MLRNPKERQTTCVGISRNVVAFSGVNKSHKRCQGYLPSSCVIRNKPDWATMRPGCVSACIEHVTYMERQTDKPTDETARVVMEALKTCLSII